MFWCASKFMEKISDDFYVEPTQIESCEENFENWNFLISEARIKVVSNLSSKTTRLQSQQV